MTPDLADRVSLAGRTALAIGASGALGARFAETLAGAVLVVDGGHPYRRTKEAGK